MTAAEEKHRIWDRYWQDSRILCPGPDGDAGIASRFHTYWADAAAALPDDARVLELACGNGFVATIVAEKIREIGKTVKIDAIDAAAIDPKRYMPERAKAMAGITFHPRTLMEDLPFEAATFDAVFSQYGIEFGNLSKSCTELGRVLKPHGIVRILAVPQTADFVADLNRKAKQALHVVEKTKLFDVARAVAQAIAGKEAAGESQGVLKYLQRFSAEVQRVVEGTDERENGIAIVSANVLQETLAKRKQMTLEEQIAAMEAIRLRLLDLVARHESIGRSALGDASLTALVRELKKTGRGDFRSQPLSTEQLGTVAWNVSN